MKIIGPKQIKLMWYGPYKISDLSEILKQTVSVSDEKYPALNNYGFYMFLENDLSNVIYIGQAFDSSPRSLRNRIRWEIIKDGNNAAFSVFYLICKDHGVDINDLILKVAHVEDANVNGKPIVLDQKLMNDIENALINKMKPLLNERGKKEYYGQSMVIFNRGEFEPLPRKITRLQFTIAES